MCVRVCVCVIWKSKKLGGLDPIWAVAAQGKKVIYNQSNEYSKLVIIDSFEAITKERFCTISQNVRRRLSTWTRTPRLE